jgi:hypothetical protein
MSEALDLYKYGMIIALDIYKQGTSKALLICVWCNVLVLLTQVV